MRPHRRAPAAWGRAVALLWAALIAWAPQSADAQADGELHLTDEPYSYVDVADAAEDGDPIDVNLTVGFRRRQTFGAIQRERPTADGRASRSWVDIANHDHTQNILDLGLDVGVFQDLMLFFRLPVILSDDRTLRLTQAGDPAAVLAENDGQGATPLFGVPFDSPTRSGLDHLAVGAAWSLLNQTRTPTWPTWVIRLEGRFNLGGVLRPCQQLDAGPDCRDWTRDDAGAWSFVDGSGGGGMSRGTNALRLETRLSYRDGYAEPFFGLGFQIEWASAARRFFLPARNAIGYARRRPPVLGEVTGGVAVIPWEDRGTAQRFAIDWRVRAAYRSAGHGYSPLFDALGTSDNQQLSTPGFEGDPSIDPDVGQTAFVGLTDMQARGELETSLRLELRAARFVRFLVGVSVAYITPFVITAAAPCNLDASVSPNDARAAGCSAGAFDPHHRPVLDLPGQRFRAHEQVRIDAFASLSALF